MSPDGVFIWRRPQMPALPSAGRPVVVCVATDGNRLKARQQMRAVLREILAHWSGLPAEALPIVETERGPVWRGLLAGESLAISFSYAAGGGWLALCRGAAVGVDAMAVTAFAEMTDVARLYLGPATADNLAKAADPAALFARAWTDWEAQLKCLKRGLTEWPPQEALPPVKRFTVRLEDAPGLAVALATVEPPMDTNKHESDTGKRAQARVFEGGVRRVREQDDQHGRLLVALEIGERDIAAGRTVPYTPDLLKQIEQEARTHAANNRPTNPDVIPYALNMVSELISSGQTERIK